MTDIQVGGAKLKVPNGTTVPRELSENSLSSLSTRSATVKLVTPRRKMHHTKKTIVLIVVPLSLVIITAVFIGIAFHITVGRKSPATANNNATWDTNSSRISSLDCSIDIIGGPMSNFPKDMQLITQYVFQFQLENHFNTSKVKDCFHRINLLDISSGKASFKIIFRNYLSSCHINIQDIFDIILEATDVNGVFGGFILDTSTLNLTVPTDEEDKTCQKSIINVCNDIGNNMTKYPNILGHTEEAEAVFELISMLDLFPSICSEFFDMYICQLYKPPCINGMALPPCKSFCEKIRKVCTPDTGWPLCECSILPDSDDPNVCVMMPDVATNCIDITNPACKDMGYQQTSYPNLAGQHNPEWINRELKVYVERIESFHCYEYIQLFACSILNPKCVVDSSNKVPLVIPPCREFCEEAFSNCLFVSQLLKVYWPSVINCSSFPSRSNDSVCISPPPVSQNKQCDFNTIQCDNGERCVRDDWVCDRVADCQDGQDEQTCASCYEGFRCNNMLCIPYTRLCDGIQDCTQGEDENNCLRLNPPDSVKSLLEVRVGPEWAAVCSDDWSEEMSQTVCQDLFDTQCTQMRGLSYKSKEHALIVSLKWNITEGARRLNPVIVSRRSCTSRKLVSLQCARDCGVVTQSLLPNMNELQYSAEVLPGASPWLVSLHGGARDTFVCGGALINNRWVLTAAHCIHGVTSLDTWKVHIGHSRRESFTSSLQLRKVERVVVHPEYRFAAVDGSDIALMKLDHPVHLDQIVNSVCLPKPDDKVEVGTTCYVTGWGKQHENDTFFSPVAQMRKLDIISNQQCQELVQQSTVYAVDIRNDSLCTLTNGSSDVCYGDSGSVLACQTHDKTWSAVGIVSWGVHCGQGYPGVYTYVSYFRDWIDSIMRSS